MTILPSSISKYCLFSQIMSLQDLIFRAIIFQAQMVNSAYEPQNKAQYFTQTRKLYKTNVSKYNILNTRLLVSLRFSY